MKYLCVFVIFAICLANCWAAIAEPAPASLDAAEQDAAGVAEKKTEKRGIYGFGYGHGFGGYGYGGHYGHGHYGGYGYGGPAYYGGYSPYYGGYHGYYPSYHHHGHGYGFY